jgi:hypothetical protein
LIGITLNIAYVYLAHVAQWPRPAAVIGFGAAVMTVSKTVLYGMHEYYSSFGHNSLEDIV